MRPSGASHDSDDAEHREYWQDKVSSMALSACDEICLMASMASGRTCRLEYERRQVNVIADGQPLPRVWIIPQAGSIKLSVRVDETELWLGRLRAHGLLAFMLEEGTGVQACVPYLNLYKHGNLLCELIADGFAAVGMSQER